MGIKGWVNLDGRVDEERGLISSKNDVLRMLWAFNITSQATERIHFHHQLY